MPARFILLICILCTACHSGILPCPKAKIVHGKRNYHFPAPTSALSAKAETDDEQHRLSRNPRTNTKVVQNVSLEEWDCPRPGMKKYMPKEVKENIRKNMRKIKSDEQKSEADSVRVNGSQ